MIVIVISSCPRSATSKHHDRISIVSGVTAYQLEMTATATISRPSSCCPIMAGSWGPMGKTSGLAAVHGFAWPFQSAVFGPGVAGKRRWRRLVSARASEGGRVQPLELKQPGFFFFDFGGGGGRFFCFLFLWGVRRRVFLVSWEGGKRTSGLSFLSSSSFLSLSFLFFLSSFSFSFFSFSSFFFLCFSSYSFLTRSTSSSNSFFLRASMAAWSILGVQNPASLRCEGQM